MFRVVVFGDHRENVATTMAGSHRAGERLVTSAMGKNASLRHWEECLRDIASRRVIISLEALGWKLF